MGAGVSVQMWMLVFSNANAEMFCTNLLFSHISYVCVFFFCTFWKFPDCVFSQVIMSKKMGMVALLSSSSGIRVISRMGPTMPGMKQIL